MADDTITAPPKGSPRANSLAVPLRIPLFRRIWFASLASNLGLLIQGVGSAWTMTQLTSQTDKVALVQTALMLPVMFMAMPAGAIADMFDRRKVGLVALCISLTGATTLTILSVLHLLSPWLILSLCFVIGSGMSLFSPAWQSSVAEQVPASALPQAIALNSISYNIARSFGPAIGGIIVATAGSVAAFGANAILYLPLIGVMLLWRRVSEPPRLPPERFGRALMSGVRYIAHSPRLRVAVGRAFVTGFAGASVSALMPIVARDLLGGQAQIYGLILGAFGLGAVVGAVFVPRVRARLSGEGGMVLSAAVMAACILVEAFSRYVPLTALALVIAGAMWMVAITSLNVAVQLSVPRWVAGRALAAYQASVSGGLAIGSWLWGNIAQDHGVVVALAASASALLLTILLGRWRPLATVEPLDLSTLDLDEPATALAVTPRSGPIVVEIEYIVDPDNARIFYELMQRVRLTRHRNGAYDWSISRDLGDTRLWTERFTCPTWLDYLRMRSRMTMVERDLQKRASDLHVGDGPVAVRRMLERPFGSVRWHADSPDRGLHDVLPIVSD